MARFALVASPRPLDLEPFLSALRSEGFDVASAATGKAALALAATRRPDILVADQGLPDAAPLDLAAQSLRVDAFINTAVVSALDAGEFHEKSEGLGVLAQLPPLPGPDDARRLAALLRGLNA